MASVYIPPVLAWNFYLGLEKFNRFANVKLSRQARFAQRVYSFVRQEGVMLSQDPVVVDLEV